ncbi:NAD(P)H-binding protein [Nocardia stercoris]|uniref:NAD-dependent epimerase/dehydratase family protein n=1 Tax=Nocardia stercoris TaxID=2483361 RepID=A0A3M2LBZ8_9NOCA|nr:NAD(P)H-binding protein [Nocardia stercoris]RMI34093.1 NAD-dependent epimerase/dehydratase family protein [Nocardia stercoris]
MILVTGATGTVGSALIELLASQHLPVRALSRRTDAEYPSGVEAVTGDFDDAESLVAAASGVTAALLLTAPSAPTAEHDRAFVAAARAAGVEKIVKLSAIATGDYAPDGEMIGAHHAAGEEAVHASGLDWTVLRPSVFASNSLSWAPLINSGGPIQNLTGSGRQGVIHPGDIAAVAAHVLTTPGHTATTYTLTGPAALTTADQVAALGTALGRDLSTVDLSEDEIRAQLTAAGMPESAVRTMISGLGYARSGKNATVTGDVESLLGRSPRTYQEWAEENRDRFLA